MADEISDGDFVELEYTGRVRDGNFVFDTTSESIAMENGMLDKNAKYGPVIVCIGQGHLLRGLEKALIGKPIGKYEAEISPEDGFGKKNAKLLQLVSTAKFREQKITPMPGLQVNIDGMYGIVKSVSGGRTVVDFNHPLSGKELQYTVDAKRIVTGTIEKLNALMKFYFKEFSATFSDGNAAIGLSSELPQQLKDKLSEEIKKLIPEIKVVDYQVKAEKA